MFLYIIVSVLLFIPPSAVRIAETVTIDDFDDGAELWVPQAESPLSGIIVSADETKNLRMICDFSQKPERCYWDKEVDLDLTKYGRFSLKVYAENPRVIRNGTIYFQSPGGWFSGWIPVEKKGWNTISLWKSDFKVEENPQSWGKITKIRLSFWNSGETDTFVLVDDLKASADEITVVMGDLAARNGQSEWVSVQSFCNHTVKVLKDLNLDFSVVNDTDVEGGALKGSRLAILPYNPGMSAKEISEIKKFVKSGGKIILYYSLPEDLAEILGIQRHRWIQQEYPGQLAFIKFNHKLKGLPEYISQGSWNTQIPKIVSPEARVLGNWFDLENKDTGISAVTINSNGMFMGHVMTPNDILNKKQMFLAVFGELVPGLQDYLMDSAINSVVKTAGFETMKEFWDFVTSNLYHASEKRFQKTTGHLSKAVNLAQKGKDDNETVYDQRLALWRESIHEVQGAFFNCFTPAEDEYRGLWCHSAFGIPGWDWDKAIKVIKDNGFNAIVPNMLWAGVTYYPSEVLPVAEEVEEKGDQIALCLEACKKYDVAIHIWKVNWNLSRAPKNFIDKLRSQDRLQKNKDGQEVLWLCPSDFRNYELEVDSMLEIVRNYHVDGIHFDYIRYPNYDSCFCPNCRKRFEESANIRVKNWPGDVIKGELKDKYVDWRCDQITRVVKAVRKKARKINPEIKISAAVFKDYPRCRETVGQDWLKWIELGYLDFVCPMDYTSDNDHFENIVKNQLDLTKQHIPLYPGLGASAPGLPPEQVAMQIYKARKIGAKGFMIFNYDMSVAADVLPALYKGITSPKE
ncbi:family 10 glycosylhydrolase [Candidatus Poribacteria bacterium]|nr:family 10 glycosylhydrolase [Candidatus Poribacteria bacterium]